jgi:pilus assembly protein CpaE
MSAQMLLVSTDAALAKTVRGALDHGIGLIEIDQLQDDVASKHDPDCVLIDSDVRDGVQTAFERIANAKRIYPSVPVIVLGNEMSAQLVLAALRAGAADFVDRTAQSQQIKMSIQTILAEVKSLHGQRNAKIAGVLSALPCDLDQDFALGLAARAAKRSNEEMTLYIDLSAPVTQCGVALGLDVEFGVADAIRELVRVDRALLESALARDTDSGLYVLPLCPKFGSDVPMLEAASFSALLEVLRRICGVIVINYGPFFRQRALIEMVQPGAHFFACCTQRFPSIRATKDLLQWFSECRLGSVPELIVHALAPASTPKSADIRKVLAVGNSIDLEAPWDELLENVNRGNSLAPSETDYTRRLDECLGRLGFAQAPQPDLLFRLRSWLGIGMAAGVS